LFFSRKNFTFGKHDLQTVVSDGILALQPRQAVVVDDCLKNEVIVFFSFETEPEANVPPE